jgi:hypothetical protein
MLEGNLAQTLQCFLDAEVQFIVVGGVASVLNGAPIQTFDIDLVYEMDPANLGRLDSALARIDAIFRIQPERRIRPNKIHLSKGGHLNLLTKFGPIDLLGSIGQSMDYASLLPNSNQMELGGGLRVWVLNLETIIQSKEQVSMDKDQATLPILRRTLEEQRKQR